MDLENKKDKDNLPQQFTTKKNGTSFKVILEFYVKTIELRFSCN